MSQSRPMSFVGVFLVALSLRQFTATPMFVSNPRPQFPGRRRRKWKGYMQQQRERGER